MALDIYLLSLNDEDYGEASQNVMNSKAIHLPLMSWDIYHDHNVNRLQTVRNTQDVTKVKLLAAKLNWQNDMDEIFKKPEFDAILVTDLNQKIVWVNRGFSKMTGYSKQEALNRTPRFLQGPKTSVTAKHRIKTKLNTNMPFKEVITNYKKDGSLYRCEVKVFPLHTNGNKTHFIALEKQVG